MLAVARGGLRWAGITDSALGTASATAMIFLVLLGADMLNTALALSQMPAELAAWVQASGAPPLLVMAAILLSYIFLGCVMDSLAMILLTIPIFHPVVMGLDSWGLGATDKSVWFGILALICWCAPSTVDRGASGGCARRCKPPPTCAFGVGRRASQAV